MAEKYQHFESRHANLTNAVESRGDIRRIFFKKKKNHIYGAYLSLISRVKRVLTMRVPFPAQRSHW